MGDMEKRLLLFFGVTFLLVSLWPRFFPAAPPPEPVPAVEGAPDVIEEPAAPPPRESASEADEPIATETEPRAPGETPADTESPEARAAGSEQPIVVETPLYRMELTNRGARIVSFKLSHHLDAENAPYEMVSQIAAEQLDIRPLDIRLDDPRLTAAVREALFEVKSPSRLTVAENEEKVVELVWSDGRGLEVDKRLTIHGDDYRLEVEISVKDQGREIAKNILFGAGIGNEVANSRYIMADKGVIVSRGEVELFSASAIEEGEGGGVAVSATGVASHYFAALMLPTNDANYGSRLEKATILVEEATDPKARKGQETADEPTRKPRDVITAILESQATPAELTFYIGPKRYERLQALAPGMEQIIELGWMRYPALLLRSGLMAIHERVGNYGWSIVLLTVLINILLLPLKHYSFVSMRKMQKIAPQTQKIRERYKKVKPTDPRYQEMNQEIMVLHKQAGVNPLSGCLPMILMIPFFFAFYRLLMTSIELRHAPFILWIQDLSVYDPLYALPILMGATQIVIQRMTPQTSADPVQGKIMAFMPVMFTFILLWAPAGLVLYWFSNNLVSMVQQTTTNRLLASRDEAQAEADKAAGAVKSVKTGKKRKAKNA